MSAQPTERVDLEIIEALDFDHEPACEHSQHGQRSVHDGPAAVLVEAIECPNCGDPAFTLYLCEPFWRAARDIGVFCQDCRHVFDEPYRLIAWVKS